MTKPIQELPDLTGCCHRFRVSDRILSGGEPTYVLAEMAWAHEGELSLALRLVDGAALADSDGIQLQIFKANRLVAPDHPGYQATIGYEIPSAGWREVVGRARDRNLDVWANVFDEESLETAVECGVDVVKLHSTDVSNPRLIEAVARTRLPLTLSVGGTTSAEIAATLAELKKRDADEVILMHGFQAFPTSVADNRLGRIRELARRFGKPVGFQDHPAGDDPMAEILPLVAVGLGAVALEKHITHDRNAAGTDSVSAHEPTELAYFAHALRRMETALEPSAIDAFSDPERTYRSKMKPSVVASWDLEEDSVLDGESADFLPAEGSIPAIEVAGVLGRVVRRSLARYQPINERDLLWTTGSPSEGVQYASAR